MTGGGERVVALRAAVALDRAAGAVAILGFAGLVAIGFLIFYDGAARSLGLPRIFGFSDYGEAIYPIVIASCFPAALLRGSNIAVTVLGKALGRRAEAALDAFAALVTLAFFCVLVWQFARHASELGPRTSRTGVLSLQPFWIVATSVMALCVPAQAFVAAVRLYAAVLGGARAPDGRAIFDAKQV